MNNNKAPLMQGRNKTNRKRNEEVKKKIQEKKHTCSPNNIIGCCLGLFYVSDVMLGSGR